MADPPPGVGRTRDTLPKSPADVAASRSHSLFPWVLDDAEKDLRERDAALG